MIHNSEIGHLIIYVFRDNRWHLRRATRWTIVIPIDTKNPRQSNNQQGQYACQPAPGIHPPPTTHFRYLIHINYFINLRGLHGIKCLTKNLWSLNMKCLMHQLRQCENDKWNEACYLEWLNFFLVFSDFSLCELRRQGRIMFPEREL